MQTSFENTQKRPGDNPYGYSDQFLKRRKLLLVLPLLLLPFMTFANWRLMASATVGQLTANTTHGINTSLPGAALKNIKPENKLRLYEDQKRDSVTIKAHSPSGAFNALGGNTNGSSSVPGNTAAVNESKITQKLAQINKEINRPEPNPIYAQNAASQQSSAETEKLQKLMNTMNTKNTEDPEMKQLNGMLEKIMDIQHPERVSEQLKAQEKKMPDSMYRAFRAAIVNNQKVTDGSSVKLRLIDSITVKGQAIPKGAFVFGYCQVTNQRLLLNIKNIRLGTSILPVDLTVYDMDGMPGINTPDVVTQDALKTGSDNAVQSMELMTMDQSMTTQLAGAGVEAAKGLFSKKIRRIKVKLKAGYPLLLRNNQPGK